MKVLPLLLIGLCAGCAQPTVPTVESASHVDRVLEDVSAMIEGMAGAHGANQVVLRGPDYRSSTPHAPE